MTKIVETKSHAAGRKHVTSQLMDTPFGQLRVEIGVRGYKSSEGNLHFMPPTDTDHESDSAEESAERPD